MLSNASQARSNNDIGGLLSDSPLAGTAFEVRPRNPPKPKPEPIEDISSIALIDAIRSTNGADQALWYFSTALGCMIIDATSRAVARKETVNLGQISNLVFNAFKVRCVYQGVTVYIGTDTHAEEIGRMPNGVISISRADGIAKKIFDETATLKAKAARDYVYGSFMCDGRVLAGNWTKTTVAMKFVGAKSLSHVSSFATAYRIARFIAGWFYDNNYKNIVALRGKPITTSDMENIRETICDQFGDTFSKLDAASRFSKKAKTVETDFHKRVVRMKGIEDAPLVQVQRLVEFFNGLYMKKAHGSVRLVR